MASEDFRGDGIISEIRKKYRSGEDPSRLLASLLPREAEAVLLYMSQMDERIEEAMKDGLTGLWRKEVFDEDMRDSVRKVMKSRRAADIPYLSLIIVDIDDFKKVNNRYGHLKGDAVLKEVARLTELSILRKTDRIYRWKKRDGAGIYRWGGEEITIRLPGTDFQGALIVANRIKGAIDDYPWEEKFNLKDSTTVSEGLSCYTTGDEDFGSTVDSVATTLFVTANYSLLCAKRVEGKNTVIPFWALGEKEKGEAYRMARELLKEAS